MGFPPFSHELLNLRKRKAIMLIWNEVIWNLLMFSAYKLKYLFQVIYLWHWQDDYSNLSFFPLFPLFHKCLQHIVFKVSCDVAIVRRINTVEMQYRSAMAKGQTRKKYSPISKGLSLQEKKLQKGRISNQRSLLSRSQPLNEV